ncbi:hypothetical protein BJG92_02490 [Arthrobacter sp. SO5]|nr:hypothetical protein [Arthrobacter sp. SO5]
MVRAGGGRTNVISAAAGEGIQRRSQRRDSRQGLHALLTPVRAFHTPKLVGTSDNLTPLAVQHRDDVQEAYGTANLAER